VEGGTGVDDLGPASQLANREQPSSSAVVDESGQLVLIRGQGGHVDDRSDEGGQAEAGTIDDVSPGELGAMEHHRIVTLPEARRNLVLTRGKP
jgi:hypothetical protein